MNDAIAEAFLLIVQAYGDELLSQEEVPLTAAVIGDMPKDTSGLAILSGTLSTLTGSETDLRGHLRSIASEHEGLMVRYKCMLPELVLAVKAFLKRDQHWTNIGEGALSHAFGSQRKS